MKKYILNKHIRYRKEDGYILMCDCKRLIDFEIPLEYFEFLNQLKEGLLAKNIKESDRVVLEDLYSMRVVLRDGEKIQSSREDIFDKLSYEESEFV